jgi:hypothetical protein
MAKATGSRFYFGSWLRSSFLVVPEPATIALMTLGRIGVLIAAKRTARYR